MKKIIRKILSVMIMAAMMACSSVPVLAEAVSALPDTALMEAEDVSITSGSVYDMTSDPAADTLLGLDQATIVITYQSMSEETYQSLFSVSNSTNGNQDRHFHIYITPSGTLGMELRNTDSEFKYTMTATNAVTYGTENSIAFTADAQSGTYKLYANGRQVSTLSKDDYKFFSDITGADTISLGGTIRSEAVDYPFGGTISQFKLYDTVLDESTLKEATGGADAIEEDFSFEKTDTTITAGTVCDLTNEQEASNMKAMTEGTVIIRYTSTGTESYQSLFSVSNSTTGNQDRHFHVYITPGGALGFELRNTDSEFKYTDSRASAVRSTYLGEEAENTIAFKADSSDGTYKLFANGQLIKELSVDNYKFISDISGVDTVSLGGTIRQGAVAYPFAGTIASAKVTNEVLSDEALIAATSDTTYGSLIFSDADATNSNYFRIPALLTLESGTIVASADARYGGTHDSKSNIDIAFSRSTDNGETWSSPTLPLCFDDYAAQRVDWPTETGLRDLQIQGSASFIDSLLVQDSESERLYMFADVMPAGIGSSNASVGNGYKTIEGKQYLMLRWHEDSNSAYNYSVRENGVIYDDRTNTPTEYTLNEDFEVLKNGTPLTVKQYNVSISGSTLYETKTDVDVAMNVFYKDSYFKVYPTCYLGMIYSDDEGATWSSLKLLNTLKSNSEKLLITGPGVGIQISNGTYAGRMVVPVYSVTLAGFGVIYSDDGGSTWAYSAADTSSTGSTAEAQIVEMPDGSLKAFVRTSSGYVAERTSIDGGVSWSEEKAVSGILSTSYGTQLSVINYSEEIDGKPAIIMSTPNSRSGRNSGVIKIGLIDDTGAAGADRYSIDWAYEYQVDGTVGYSYSCMAELPDGTIGVYYEKYDSWSRNQLHLKNILAFEKYTVEQLKAAQ